jgi:CubicO group peptidase (beta-lactamase class C family)
MRTKYFLIVTSLVVILILGTGCDRNYKSLSGKLDTLLKDYAITDQFMGSDKGKVIFAKGYGLADVERNIPNTPDTQFMIGSITKQFTAMLVTQLVEKGKLKLDNKITDFVPEFPREIGDKITVEMLLCHTSGLIFPEGIEKYYYASTKEEYLQEYIKQLSEEGLRFEPGKGYGYSNAGYFILGLIIEKVTGKSYEEVLIEQILKPLGMTQTGCDRKGLVVANRATSYAKLQDRYTTWNEETNGYDPAVCGFAYGNLYSTVGDLFKFSHALTTNRLLSKKYMDTYLQMRNVKTRIPIPGISKELVKDYFGTFGNGFVGEISILEDTVTREKEMLYWHDGTCKLFKSNHFHYAGNNQIIIICSNCSFLCEGNEMVLKLHQLLNDKPYAHILIKHSLSQYISEDVAMHAGIPAAVDEYFRLKDDTARFSVPSQDWMIWAGRFVAEEMGDLDNGILLFKAAITSFPDSWQIYDAMGEVYAGTGDKTQAIQAFKKSLELNPGNAKAQQMLKKLESK